MDSIISSSSSFSSYFSFSYFSSKFTPSSFSILENSGDEFKARSNSPTPSLHSMFSFSDLNTVKDDILYRKDDRNNNEEGGVSLKFPKTSSNFSGNESSVKNGNVDADNIKRNNDLSMLYTIITSSITSINLNKENSFLFITSGFINSLLELLQLLLHIPSISLSIVYFLSLLFSFSTSYDFSSFSASPSLSVTLSPSFFQLYGNYLIKNNLLHSALPYFEPILIKFSSFFENSSKVLFSLTNSNDISGYLNFENDLKKSLEDVQLQLDYTSIILIYLFNIINNTIYFNLNGINELLNYGKSKLISLFLSLLFSSLSIVKSSVFISFPNLDNPNSKVLFTSSPPKTSALSTSNSLLQPSFFPSVFSNLSKLISEIVYVFDLIVQSSSTRQTIHLLTANDSLISSLVLVFDVHLLLCDLEKKIDIYGGVYRSLLIKGNKLQSSNEFLIDKQRRKIEKRFVDYGKSNALSELSFTGAESSGLGLEVIVNASKIVYFIVYRYNDFSLENNICKNAFEKYRGISFLYKLFVLFTSIVNRINQPQSTVYEKEVFNKKGTNYLEENSGLNKELYNLNHSKYVYVYEFLSKLIAYILCMLLKGSSPSSEFMLLINYLNKEKCKNIEDLFSFFSSSFKPSHCLPYYPFSLIALSSSHSPSIFGTTDFTSILSLFGETDWIDVWYGLNKPDEFFYSNLSSFASSFSQEVLLSFPNYIDSPIKILPEKSISIPYVDKLGETTTTLHVSESPPLKRSFISIGKSISPKRASDGLVDNSNIYSNFSFLKLRGFNDYVKKLLKLKVVLNQIDFYFDCDDGSIFGNAEKKIKNISKSKDNSLHFQILGNIIVELISMLPESEEQKLEDNHIKNYSEDKNRHFDKSQKEVGSFPNSENFDFDSLFTKIIIFKILNLTTRTVFRMYELFYGSFGSFSHIVSAVQEIKNKLQKINGKEKLFYCLSHYNSTILRENILITISLLNYDFSSYKEGNILDIFRFILRRYTDIVFSLPSSSFLSAIYSVNNLLQNSSSSDSNSYPSPLLLASSLHHLRLILISLRFYASFSLQNENYLFNGELHIPLIQLLSFSLPSLSSSSSSFSSESILNELSFSSSFLYDSSSFNPVTQALISPSYLLASDSVNLFANITKNLSLDKKRVIINNSSFLNTFKSIFTSSLIFLKNSLTKGITTTSSSYLYEYEFIKPYTRILVNILHEDSSSSDVFLFLFFFLFCFHFKGFKSKFSCF
jgi:hypothetical protein